MAWVEGKLSLFRFRFQIVLQEQILLIGNVWLNFISSYQLFDPIYVFSLDFTFTFLRPPYVYILSQFIKHSANIEASLQANLATYKGCSAYIRKRLHWHEFYISL